MMELLASFPDAMNDLPFQNILIIDQHIHFINITFENCTVKEAKLKMGIREELVKSVFSKHKPAATQERNVRSSVGDKRRWSSVRSYLCGDEFNSVMADEDSASVKSSEVTLIQPVFEDFLVTGDYHTEETKEESSEYDQSSIDMFLLREDAAATFIQAVFRGFMVRRQIKRKEAEEEDYDVEGGESPSSNSVGTSLEVQTAHSMEVFSRNRQRLPQKYRTQVFKCKEDWDDSILSTTIAKMRMQNKLEATTRRERALAYAFSQQLRICSKKRNKSDGTDSNMSWNWLERWMATRVPDSYSSEDPIMKPLEPMTGNGRCLANKKSREFAREEKESCGSNEVPINISASTTTEECKPEPATTKLKARRRISRRKTMPSYNCPKECSKATKKETADTDMKHKLKEVGIKKEVNSRSTALEMSKN